MAHSLRFVFFKEFWLQRGSINTANSESFNAGDLMESSLIEMSGGYLNIVGFTVYGSENCHNSFQTETVACFVRVYIVHSIICIHNKILLVRTFDMRFSG